MFEVGDLVRTLEGDLIGRVISEFTEFAGEEATEQVVTLQVYGTIGFTGQVRRLASDLTIHDEPMELPV